MINITEPTIAAIPIHIITFINPGIYFSLIGGCTKWDEEYLCSNRYHIHIWHPLYH